MSLTIYTPTTQPDTITMTMCTTGGIVGATVSALVYNTITATGDVTAALASSGISATGNLIAFGTEYVAGTMAANTVRVLTRTSSALTGPAIVSGSRTAAVSLSLVAGGLSALTASALVYGTKKVGDYLYYKTEKYKERVAMKVQYPINHDEEIELLYFDEVGEVDDMGEETENTIVKTYEVD